MGHGNQTAKKHGRQWKLLDVISLAFFVSVAVFFLLVFTRLGDSLAATGRQALVLTATDPRQRARLIGLVESGQPLEACPADAVDNMPCEDPRRNSQLSRERNFYRERHCPALEESLLCLVPPPPGYQIPVSWPESMYKIWHSNMPYNKIAERKGHQGWMKQDGPYFVFPGGGTMFPDGALSYIDKLAQHIPIGKGSLRTALDMGCGVASFGGFLLSKEILTLSFAPRDSHKSQIQFALERGIPAFVAMLGTRRLPFPAHSFELVHCSRCLIPFTAYNGTYFLEVDRLLRPGGNLVISGPPVQWAKQEKEWADLQAVARALCYELIVVEENTAIWKKPLGDSCLPNPNQFGIDFCSESSDSSYAWYFELESCVSRSPIDRGEDAVETLPEWPLRLNKPSSRTALMKSGPGLFEADTKRWTRRIAYYKSLSSKLGSPSVRNVMDMNAFLGGFAASIISDPVWVMNIVPAQKPSTLGVIYDRGLVGVYHDWCEAFSTYPRTYDLIHAGSIDSLIRDATTGDYRCNLVDVMVEIDRILRPEGTVIVRDSPDVIKRVARISKSIRWSSTIYDTEPESTRNEKLLIATKTSWKL